jgi:protein O-mannosyl-transferase
VAIRTAPDGQAIAGLAIVAALVAGCVAARRRWPIPVFGAMWTAIALVPVSNLLVPSGVLLAERSLFLPSVGAMLVPVALVQVRMGWPAAVVASLLVATGLARSVLRAPVWRDDATLWAVSAAESPRNYFTHYQYGTELFREGRVDDAERELRTAIALEPEDPRLYASLGWRLTTANRCDAAAPLFRQALALSPTSYEARAGLVTCLMRAGDYPAARSLALVAVAHGGHQAFFARAIAAADSAQRIAR